MERNVKTGEMTNACIRTSYTHTHTLMHINTHSHAHTHTHTYTVTHSTARQTPTNLRILRVTVCVHNSSPFSVCFLKPGVGLVCEYKCVLQHCFPLNLSRCSTHSLRVEHTPKTQSTLYNSVIVWVLCAHMCVKDGNEGGKVIE